VKTGFTIVVSANPPIGGEVSGGGSYSHGSTATVTASPNNNYQFVNWTEENIEVSVDATYVFNVTDNRFLIANFAINQYAVTYNTPTNGVLTVLEGNNPVANGTVVDHGTVLRITATPDKNYQLETLTVNGDNFTSGNIHTVTSATSIECVFVYIPSNDASLGSVLVSNQPAAQKPGDAKVWQITIEFTTSITIVATANHHAAKVEASHQGVKQVKVGINPFEISVTAENGSKVNHSLEVTVKEKPTGVDEYMGQPLIAYPNPERDNITISGLQGYGILTVFDAAGRLWIQRNIASSQETISVSALPQGSYFVQIVEGERIRTIKIMVE